MIDAGDGLLATTPRFDFSDRLVAALVMMRIFEVRR